MSVENKIINVVGQLNFLKGNNYDMNKIKLIKIIHMTDKSKIYKFSVESERIPQLYNVDITNKNNEIVLTYCSCPQFEKEKKCKHIAACLIKEQDKIFNNEKQKENINISDLIFKNIINNNSSKQLLKLELELNFHENYYNSGLYIKFKVGIDKLYYASSKTKYFFELYNGEDNQELTFGKNFTYNPKFQYFSDEDCKILDFLCSEFYKFTVSHYYNSEIFISENMQPKFFKLLKNRDYYINGYGLFHGYKEEFPFETEIKQLANNYIFKFNFENPNFQFLSFYILIKDKNIYLMSNDYIKIIEQFAKYDLTEIEFNQNSLPLFAESIYPTVKDTIKVEQNIADKLCIIDPITKLYFDLLDDNITCDLKFNYNNNEINYFDETNIIRNRNFEQNIINELTSLKFKIDNKQIYLDTLENIGNFLENDLINLSKKYEVYTTKKLDETNIIKKNKIESQFSIGQDNIMSYHFSIENINIDEIADIFETLNEKKKYYKLKSGNILDLENNNELKELQNLVDDLDLNYKSLETNGTIPKYRAIYLDSLKDNYSIIQTDNLFNKFVNDFKQYKNSTPYINEHDKKILRDYQLIGVKWLYNIYKCNLGGILADEMGLGKSLQTICFIKAILKEKENIRILIVSPTSLIYNWEKEFDKFAKELNYCVIAEGKNKRQEILNNLSSNIVITTYGLLRQDKELYEQLNFEVMIIDEAQNIKNPTAQITKTAKLINAKCKIVLTGTPVENSVIELWSIFDFIMPGFLTNLMKFQTKYNIKDFSDEKINILNNLNMQISPFILRRKKIDVAKDLPEKQENNIYFDMYQEQKKLYVAELKKTKKEMDEIIATEGFIKARFKILQLLTKLRQICIDPKILFENYSGGSIKIDELINLTKKIIDNGHKILLFTSFKTALNIVKEKFDKEKITSYTIDGSVPSKKRMELVDKFNNDNTNVFLIMLKAGGTGLNLTIADVVIHLDLWWNPQVENQATDRAHRIGQTKNVEVIKLICNGTIEERIIELQNKKKLLSDTLIEGKNRDQNLLEKLSEKDIKNLLTFDEE